VELQALLDEDDSALVNKLFPIAYKRWERFRKSADGCHMNWEMERRKNTCEILLEWYRRKSFLHRIVTGGWKVDFFWESQAQKIMDRPRHPPQDRITFGRKTMLCVWWDQKGVVYYELLKPGETVNTKRYQQQSIWTVRLKNDQNTKRGNTRSFFFMTMRHHIRQNQFRTRWKHSAEKFYPMQLTYQTWLLPITICLYRWVTHLLNSALVHMKMWKNGSMNSSRQKGKIFTGVISTNCPKDGKNI